MEKRARRAITKISILILVILLISVTFQQYFQYAQERSGLENSITLTQKYLEQARVLEANPEKFIGEIEKLEKQCKELHLLVPPVMDVEGFQDQFSNLAKSVGVDVCFKDSEIRHHDFYKEARLSVTLSGNREGVTLLIHKQYEQPRIAAAERVYREVDDRFCLDLTIYSLKESRQKGAYHETSIEKRFCPTFESELWMWPFTRMITAFENKYETVCGEVMKNMEALCSIDKLKDKMRYVQADLKVTKQLTEYCVPKLSETLGELYKDLEDFPGALHYFSWLLEHREKELGKDHPEVAAVMEKMATCYKGMGKNDKAEWLEKRIRQIRSKQ